MAGASLIFDIFGRDKGVAKMFDDVAKKAGGLGPVFEGAGALVGKLAGPLLAIGAGVGIKKFVDDSVKSFDDLAAGVNGLKRVMGGSTEQVSAMRGAMQLAGVNVDEVGGSIQKFAKALGGADASSAASQKMMQTLGFKFQDANGAVKPMTELLPQLADKFKSMPDGAEKTALAMQLFGKQGATMIPFLNKGSAGIAELEGKAKSMGLTLDDTSIKIMAAGKVSARDFAASIQGMKVQLGQDIAPIMTATQNITRAAVTPILTGLTGLFQSARGPMLAFSGVIQAHADKVGATMTALVAKIGAVLGGLKSGMQLPTIATAGMTGPLAEAVKIGALAGRGFREVTGGIRAFFAAFKAGGDDVTSSGFAGVLESAGLFARHLWDSLAPLLPTLAGLYTNLSPVHLVLSAIMPVLPQLAAAFGQVGQVLAAVLPQLLASLVPVVGQVIAAVSSLLPPIIGLIPVIVQLAASILPPLLAIFAQLAPVVLQIVQVALVPLVTMLAGILPPIIGQLAGLFVSLVPVFMQIVQAVLGVVMALLPLIPVVLQLVGAVLPPLLAVLSAIIPVILQIITGAILPLVQFLGGVLIGTIQALMPTVQIVFAFISDSIKNAMQVIHGVIDVVMGLISGNWGQVWQGIQEIAGGIWNQITNIVGSAGAIIGSLVGSLLGFIGDIPGKIGGFFAGAGTWLWDAGVNLVNGLFEGVKSLAGTIGNFFLNLMPDWIREPFKAALGIHSPSRVFAGYGVNIGQGLIDGITGMAPAIDRRISTLVPATVQAPTLTGGGSGLAAGAAAGGYGAGSAGARLNTAGPALNIENIHVHEAEQGGWQHMGNNILQAVQVQAPRVFA